MADWLVDGLRHAMSRDSGVEPAGEVAMAALQVFLFGQFRIRHSAGVPVELEGDKVRELFCYLLLHRRHLQPRESLATLLWPDSSPPRARRNLRQTLWQLQVALHEQVDTPAVQSIVYADPEWIGTNPDADIWLDVMAFEQAFATVHCRSDQEILAEQSAEMMRAVELYTAELLEGWYQDWCLHERERLASMYRAMLDKLVGYCTVHGDYEAGLAYGERLLAEDPARERVHRRLMRLHYLRGDRTEALRQYERCVAALAAELGVKPSRRTVALYEQLRADRLEPGRPSLVQLDELAGELHPGAPELARSLRQIIGELAQLRRVLAQVQDQLQDQIRTVEHS